MLNLTKNFSKKVHNGPYNPHSASPNINILYNHSTIPKPEKCYNAIN